LKVKILLEFYHTKGKNMKILLIHSENVEVRKNKKATSNPQEFAEDLIKMNGLILIT